MRNSWSVSHQRLYFWPVLIKFAFTNNRPIIGLLLVKAISPCRILLQVSRDVAQIVEHLCDTSEWYDSVIDCQIEDVELAWLHLQVTA
jgi:hypothetical protein